MMPGIIMQPSSTEKTMRLKRLGNRATVYPAIAPSRTMTASAAKAMMPELTIARPMLDFTQPSA